MTLGSASSVGGSVIEDLRLARRHGVALGVGPQGSLDYATSSGSLDPGLAVRLKARRPAILRHLAEVAGVPSGAWPAGRMATAAEARMWFLHRLDPGSTAYGIPSHHAGGGSVPAVAEAIRLLIGAHPALHARFRQVGDWPWRFEWPERRRPTIVDLDHRVIERSSGDVLPGLDPLRRRFDLERDPAIAAAVVRGPDGGASTIIAAHHIAVDARSNALLRRRFDGVLADVADGRPVDLRSAAAAASANRLPRPFADPASLDQEWLDQLRTVGDPLASWRRPDLDWRRDTTTELTVDLDVRDSASSLNGLAHRFEVAPFTIAVAALAAALAGTGDLQRVAIGFAVDDREPEDEEVVGLFVNTAVAVVSLHPSTTWADLIESAEQAVLTALDHRRLGFDRLAELVDPDRSIDRSAVTPVLLTAHRDRGPDASDGGRWLNPRCELDVELDWSETAVRAAVRVPQALFRREAVAALGQALASALTDMATSPEALVDDLPSPAPIWTGADHLTERVDVGIMGTSIDRLDTVATSDRLGQLTRRQLLIDILSRARALAPLVEPGDRVAVLVDRGADLPATLLAVWLAGASYVPLDHRSPPARQAQILERSGASLLITSDDSVPPPIGVDRLVFGRHRKAESQDRVAPRGCWGSPDAEAYVLFTSGSTGEPKGVSISHGGLAQLVAWARLELGDQLERVLASTALTFDLSAFELFAPLAGTGSVHVVESIAEPGLDPTGLGCTLVNTVPSALRAVVDRPGFGLDRVNVNVAGEALRRRDVRILGPGIGCLRNLYGPSEATTYASMAQVDPASSSEPTIGALLPHLGGFVAGPTLRPLVEGVRGQLVLAGSALADGYVADTRSTADRFRPDPNGDGGRIYLTGDLTTWLRGDLHFHGRADRQVKLSGQRVELDEIEVWLGRHPAVDASGVVLGGGHRRLVVGHVQVTGPAPTEQEIRSWMAERLPPYLVCDRIVIVDALPLNPNGKVDHRALAGRAVPSPPVTTAPVGRREGQIAACWARVLGLDSVDVMTPFFDLGGSSLLLLALQDELRHELSLDIPIVDLLGHPTVRSLAVHLDDPQPVGGAGEERGGRRRRLRRRRTASRARYG